MYSQNKESLANSSYLISLLTNKAEKLLCRIDLYKPFHITVDNVDSIDVRTQIWNFVRNNPEVMLYIDSRMGLEVMQVFSLNLNDPWHVKYYESTPFPSDEAIPVQCTAKSIMYTVMAVASLFASKDKAYIGESSVGKYFLYSVRNVDTGEEAAFFAPEQVHEAIVSNNLKAGSEFLWKRINGRYELSLAGNTAALHDNLRDTMCS